MTEIDRRGPCAQPMDQLRAGDCAVRAQLPPKEIGLARETRRKIIVIAA